MRYGFRSSWRWILGSLVTLTLMTSGVSAASAATPARPLLLVGGTFGPVTYMDDALAYFRAQGFTAYSMPLSGEPPGSVNIKISARAVCDRIDEIRQETGAAKVDVVGHSQGALAVRYCVKFDGGLGTVDTMISLGGVNYGTAKANYCVSTSCVQMRPGSAFLDELNEGDDTPGDVDYAHLYSYESNGGINGEDIPLADGATNVAAQDLCPGQEIEHRYEYDSPIMRDLIVDAALHQELTAVCP
jgi:triacylglycerol esterase/lipase EstA (alpha/beta hydrolase family)